MGDTYEEQIVRLMRDVRTDHLTGCGNYRAFTEYTQLLVDGAAPFSVVLFDMTNLRHANRQLGHFGADRMLARVGEKIRSGYDHVFRHGGDEFAVVMPLALWWGATAVRDRIEAAVGVTHLAGGQPLRLVGAVACWAPGLNLHDILNQADRALEARKATTKKIVEKQP